MGLDITWAVDWVRQSADVISDHRVELIDLDRAIGDGDHGENMDRGFRAVMPKLDDLPAGSTRGKAEVGDKTMVDAWTPAVEAAEKVASKSGDAAAVLAAAADAARVGSDATIPLVARKGRASYLGERSAGHRDPGAQSTALLLQAAADTASTSAGA